MATAKTIPISYDVTVNVSLNQVSASRDLSLSCLLSTAVGFDRINRFKIYEDFDSFVEDIPSTKTAYWAGNAFFDQSPHPKFIAVGQVNTESQAAVLFSGTDIDVSALAAIDDGAFNVQLGTAVVNFTSLDFTGCTTLANVVSVLGARASLNADGDGIILTAATTGDTSLAGYATSPTSGTDVSALLNLTSATALGKENGYTYVSLEDEAVRVQNAAAAAGYFIYGWALDYSLRTTENQTAFAAWAEAQDYAVFGVSCNQESVKSSSSTTDIAYVLKTAGYKRSVVAYCSNEELFPEVSYLAYALATDYKSADTDYTMKFKDLPGIDTESVTTTELGVILAKRANVLTLTAGDVRVLRNGTQAAPSWDTNVLIGLDNLRADLETNVFNVFLSNKKVPYTYKGQMKLVSAVMKTGNKYTKNGVLADRRVEDSTSDTGYSVLTAFSAVPSDISTASDSDRASHIGPPISVTAYLSGYIGKITINVSAIQ